MIIKILEQFNITGYPTFSKDVMYILPDTLSIELINRGIAERAEIKLENKEEKPKKVNNIT